MAKNTSLPPYMQSLYNKIYSNSFWSGIMDDSRIANIVTLGADKKLTADVVKEIARNAHVLQIGLTFGDEIEQVYRKICKQGKFDIFDISELQLSRATQKFGHYNINLIKKDATESWQEKYDVIICYNLLSEIPAQSRNKIMTNALNSLSNGGKALFIDCCKPEKYNLLRFPLKLFNLLYKPFSLDLWNKPIENMTDVKNNFRWHHTYYYGKMFQKVIAIRKILSSEDVRKLTRMFKNGK